MATLRQKRVAKKIVENSTLDKPKSAGQVLKSVGYGTGLQNQPKRVLESDGVQEELTNLGFTEDNAKRVVTDILESDKAANTDKLRASDMIFKVHGSYAAEKRVSVNVNTTVENTKASGLADKYEEELKKLT